MPSLSFVQRILTRVREMALAAYEGAGTGAIAPQVNMLKRSDPKTSTGVV